jgi:hypothetical protein
MVYAVDDDSPRVLRHPAEDRPVPCEPEDLPLTSAQFRRNLRDRYSTTALPVVIHNV